MQNNDVKGREQFLDTVFEFQKYPDSIFFAVANTKADLGKYDEARRVALELVARDEKYREEVETFIHSLP